MPASSEPQALGLRRESPLFGGRVPAGRRSEVRRKTDRGERAPAAKLESFQQSLQPISAELDAPPPFAIEVDNPKCPRVHQGRQLSKRLRIDEREVTTRSGTLNGHCHLSMRGRCACLRVTRDGHLADARTVAEIMDWILHRGWTSRRIKRSLLRPVRLPGRRPYCVTPTPRLLSIHPTVPLLLLLLVLVLLLVLDLSDSPPTLSTRVPSAVPDVRMDAAAGCWLASGGGAPFWHPFQGASFFRRCRWVSVREWACGRDLDGHPRL